MTARGADTADEPVDEVSGLIDLLHRTSARIAELTGGEVDAVADSEGRPFLLRHAQENLRRSESDRQAAILDALPAHIALLDTTGIVVSVNESWRRFADANGLEVPGYGVGLNYLATCDQASQEASSSAQKAAGAIRAILAGGRGSTSIEYPCDSPTEKRWFLMTATPLSTELRRGAVVMHVDITERKQAEEILRQVSHRVVGSRQQQLRKELAILAAATAAFFGLSVRLDWFEAATGWLSAHAVPEIDEIVFTMIFALAGLAVFAFRRWREAESELNTREKSQAVMGLLRYELERRVRERTEELDRANETLNAEITERKRSEQAAERALQRLTEAQRIGQIGDWEFDLATQAISWSPQVYEILGRNPRLGPPQGITESRLLFHEASRPALMKGVAIALESGDPQDYELEAQRPNGEQVHVLGRAAPRKDEHGRVVGLYGTLQDITERKRSAAAVKESERRYHSLFENMLEGYAYCETVFDQNRLTDFIYLEVNTAFGTLTGLKDVIGRKVSDVIPGFLETNKEFIELYERVALSGRPEKREAFVEGLNLWLSITAYSSDQGHFVAVFDDITARKAGEGALRRSEEEFRALAESMPQMVWITRPDGWNVYFSQQWMDYTGLTLQESLGHGWNQPFHPEDRPRAWDAWQDATTTSGRYSIECRLRRADGVYRWWLIRGVPVKDAAGTILKWFGTCTDIHDLKLAELEIQRSNRVYAMLSGINTLVVRVRDREELVQEACRIAVAAGGFRMSLIAVVDRATGAIVPVASAGKDEGLMAQVGALLADPETAPRTMVGHAIRTKLPIVSNDSVNDPRLIIPTRYAESQVRSIAVLPLLIADEAVGVLALYSNEVDFFHEEEMKLLGELADNIAFCKEAIRSRDHKKRADEALRASLKEKEALLKEVHHRVKNNMQVITSLLRLESNRIDHPTTKSVLKDMQNRILAMASLHEALYRSNSFAQVDLESYLKELTTQLQRSLVASPGQIAFHLELLPVGLDLDQAVPCGLIVNELVSNALKHGFPNGRRGEVRVKAEWVSDGLLRLRISDNGIGLSQDFAELRVRSLGLQLVGDLARQLGGILVIGPGPEALFEITFRPGRQDGRPPG
jgi:PAS domain S-box-containing protein